MSNETTMDTKPWQEASMDLTNVTPRELARAMFFGRLSDPHGDQAERSWMASGGDRGALDYGAAMVLRQLRSDNDGECAPHQFVHTPEDGVLCAACGKEGADDDLA